MRQLSIFKHSLTTGLCWGIIGGLLMVITKNLPFKTSILEITMLIIYSFCLIASVLVVQLNQTDKKAVKLFTTSLLTFILIFLFTHFYLFLTNMSKYNFKIWWLLIWFAIGIPISLLLTFLVTRRR